jgi:hypothetical protein
MVPKRPFLEASKRIEKFIRFGLVRISLMLFSVQSHLLQFNDLILTLKQKSALTTTGSQVVKYRKLKPTNPKPFKFRTDVSKDLCSCGFI